MSEAWFYRNYPQKISFHYKKAKIQTWKQRVMMLRQLAKEQRESQFSQLEEMCSVARILAEQEQPLPKQKNMIEITWKHKMKTLLW